MTSLSALKTISLNRLDAKFLEPLLKRIYFHRLLGKQGHQPRITINTVCSHHRLWFYAKEDNNIVSEIINLRLFGVEWKFTFEYHKKTWVHTIEGFLEEQTSSSHARKVLWIEYYIFRWLSVLGVPATTGMHRRFHGSKKRLRCWLYNLRQSNNFSQETMFSPELGNIGVAEFNQRWRLFITILRCFFIFIFIILILLHYLRDEYTFLRLFFA